MRAISWTAFLPSCGVAPCAALPRVSSSSHKLPLCAVTTCNRVGSPTMARVVRSRLGCCRHARRLQAGRLRYERARTGLRVFLVNQSGENNFRFQRTRFGFRQFAKRGEHGGDGTFRVARAAAIKPSVFPLRNELRIIRADGVEVRREQDGLADFVSRPQARDEIGTPGQHFLKFDFQSGARGDRGQKIRDALFAKSWQGRPAGRPRPRGRAALPQQNGEGRIHAGQRDEFGQQFFGARHAPEV